MSVVQFAGLRLKHATYQIISESGLWTHPEPGVPYRVLVEVVAGGGGGGGGAAVSSQAASANHAGGGDGGVLGARHIAEITVVSDQEVIVGAGGLGGAERRYTTSGSATQVYNGYSGGMGGNSSFGKILALGGNGGIAGVYNSTPYGGVGSSTTRGAHTHFASALPYVVHRGTTAANQTYGGSQSGGGGGGGSYTDAATATAGGAAVSSNLYGATAQAGENCPLTDYGAAGAGGGGAGCLNAASGRIMVGGAGGDGAPGVVHLYYWSLRK